MHLVNHLIQQKLITPPAWLADNVHYLTIMGSIAYGVADTNEESAQSDFDVYGWVVPPREIVFPHTAGAIWGFGKYKEGMPKSHFGVYQNHHIHDDTARGGKGRTYDLQIYNVVKFVQLCMECNPNMIDSLFTPETCVLHVTQVGQILRDNRKKFLHQGICDRFKGYAYAQVHKMQTKEPQPGSKRAALREKHGYDCYDEAETEFLTDQGWKRFDDVDVTHRLGTVDILSGRLRWEKPLERIDKEYSGSLYTIEPYLMRCVVTPNHRMLVSPAHRNTNTHFTYRYLPDRGQWGLIPLAELMTGKRSWYHVRRAVEPRTEEYPVSDEFLILAGLFISEGSLSFRNQAVKAGRVSQTAQGKAAFFEAADTLVSTLELRRYDYTKETVWAIPRELASRLFHEFGHGSRYKRLPPWCFQLSHRQALLLWEHACLGDGTEAPNGDVYYSVNQGLAGDLQAMLVSAGEPCSVRGPYDTTSICSYSVDPKVFQVYRPDERDAYRCIDFKSRIRRDGEEATGKVACPIKEQIVRDRRIVCFEVPSGTLVTRSQGCVAIQGNSKFAYHTVRLLNEAEQLLLEGDVDLMRNREQLKSIRRGEWTMEQILDYFEKKRIDLETARTKSSLPVAADEPAIRDVLLRCLEAHYGSLDKAITVPGKAEELLRQIRAKIEASGY
jgi:hypothetical protein